MTADPSPIAAARRQDRSKEASIRCHDPTKAAPSDQQQLPLARPRPARAPDAASGIATRSMRSSSLSSRTVPSTRCNRPALVAIATCAHTAWAVNRSRSNNRVRYKISSPSGRHSRYRKKSGNCNSPTGLVGNAPPRIRSWSACVNRTNHSAGVPPLIPASNPQLVFCREPRCSDCSSSKRSRRGQVES